MSSDFGTSTTVTGRPSREVIVAKGDDFSCQRWQGTVNGALVLDFAGKVKKTNAENFPEDLVELSSAEILRTLQLDSKKAAGILFGDVKVRIAHYDINKRRKQGTNVRLGLKSLKRQKYHAAELVFALFACVWINNYGFTTLAAGNG